MVHNLRAMDRSQADLDFDWARRFNEHLIDTMTTRPSEAAALTTRPNFNRIAPTDEHFLPLLYIAGFAAEAQQTPQVLVDGYAFGSLSMTSCIVGLECPEKERGLPGSAPLATDVATEDSNM